MLVGRTQRGADVGTDALLPQHAPGPEGTLIGTLAAAQLVVQGARAVDGDGEISKALGAHDIDTLRNRAYRASTIGHLRRRMTFFVWVTRPEVKITYYY